MDAAAYWVVMGVMVLVVLAVMVGSALLAWGCMKESRRVADLFVAQYERMQDRCLSTVGEYDTVRREGLDAKMPTPPGRRGAVTLNGRPDRVTAYDEVTKLEPQYIEERLT